jgi:hypothetical protein
MSPSPAEMVGMDGGSVVETWKTSSCKGHLACFFDSPLSPCLICRALLFNPVDNTLCIFCLTCLLRGSYTTWSNSCLALISKKPFWVRSASPQPRGGYSLRISNWLTTMNQLGRYHWITQSGSGSHMNLLIVVLIIPNSMRTRMRIWYHQMLLICRPSWVAHALCSVLCFPSS